jgi:two-component system, LytTR family, response regulator
MSNKLRVLIVDDEQDSRNTLENYLIKYCGEIEIVDKCENIQLAKKVIDKEELDIVFLDVEMPYGNGFDLLDSLHKMDFEIIFVTAFSHYAIKALNLSASYYLLKPVDIGELEEAVNKVRKNKLSQDNQLHTKVLIENLSQANKQNQRVILPLLDGFEVIKVGDIVYCQAEDNFTRFFLANGKEMLICRTLKHYEEALEECGFSRIHRSYLINLDFVTKYNKGKGGFVTMNNGTELEVSATRKEAFLSVFGLK